MLRLCSSLDAINIQEVCFGEANAFPWHSYIQLHGRRGPDMQIAEDRAAACPRSRPPPSSDDETELDPSEQDPMCEALIVSLRELLGGIP